MAAGLSFFSSPPHPTSNPWQGSTDATTFYTPQHASKHSWSGAYAPTSPSPLRTSRNANLMSTPFTGGERTGKLGGDDSGAQDENTIAQTPVSGLTMMQQSLPFSNADTSLAANSATPFSTTTTNSTPIFSFTNAPANPDQTLAFATPAAHDRALQFQYSARARSSSPSALLQSHTKDNRDSRKRLFLDRLRNKRDDARTDRTGEQVLRMDYMKERRDWVAGMERSGVGFDLDGDDTMDEGVVDSMSGGLTPTEEREVEELAERYYSLQEMHESQQQQQQQPQQGQAQYWHSTGEEGFREDFSDDGYEEAFMEVLSQEDIRPGLSTGPHRDPGTVFGMASHQDHSHQQSTGGGDLDMDMS